LLGDDKISALDLGRHAWEVAIRRYPPCMVINLNRAVLDSIPRLKPVPFGPWDWPYPGPEDGPPRPPIPPTALAQAALGAAIVAVHELGPEGVLSDSAIERLADVALRGVRERLEAQINTTRVALEELERTAALFNG
jgi:hypothetical protein